MEEKIKYTIEKIRPYIQSDGGDVEFVSYDINSGIVKIRMLGACSGCIGLDSTIGDGIEAILLDEVEGVTKVIVVNEFE